MARAFSRSGITATAASLCFGVSRPEIRIAAIRLLIGSRSHLREEGRRAGQFAAWTDQFWRLPAVLHDKLKMLRQEKTKAS